MAEQIKASHILLMYAGSASSTARRTKKDAANEILELYKKISGGDKFEKIAQRNILIVRLVPRGETWAALDVVKWFLSLKRPFLLWKLEI